MNHQPVEPIKILDKQTKTWSLILHLSQLGNFIIPLSGFIAPIVIWQLKKDEIPALDEHGRNVANWLLSALIYGFICGLLSLVVIGFFLGIALLVANIAFVIIGSVKANDGVAWKYPGAIRFF
jgi:uncharacterized Tic20 family protein